MELLENKEGQLLRSSGSFVRREINIFTSFTTIANERKIFLPMSQNNEDIDLRRLQHLLPAISQIFLPNKFPFFSGKNKAFINLRGIKIIRAFAIVGRWHSTGFCINKTLEIENLQGFISPTIGVNYRVTSLQNL